MNVAMPLQATSKVRKPKLKVVEPIKPEPHKKRPVVSRSTPLPGSDEVLKLVQLAKQGDLTAQDEIIRANMGVIHLMAHKLARKTNNQTHDADDLVQEGVFGLIAAIQKFDESFGVRFLSYASYWIKAFMGRYIAKAGSPLKGTLHVFVKYRHLLKRYEQAVMQGEDPEQTLAMLAKTVQQKTTPKQLQEHFDTLKTMRVQSLDYAMGDETLVDLIPGQFLSQDKYVETQQTNSMVQRAAASLRSRGLTKLELVTLRLRLLPSKDREPCTLQHIGDKMNVSRERVRQVEVAVKKKMARALTELMKEPKL